MPFQTALQEVAFHKQLHHPAILQCLGSEVTGEPDIAANVTCEVYILLPFLPVSRYLPLVILSTFYYQFSRWGIICGLLGMVIGKLADVVNGR